MGEQETNVGSSEQLRGIGVILLFALFWFTGIGEALIILALPFLIIAGIVKGIKRLSGKTEASRQNVLGNKALREYKEYERLYNQIETYK